MPLFRTQSAVKQTSLAPHDSKARLQDVTNRRRFMAKPCTPHLIPQAAQLFKIETANVRGQGAAPLAFSWGSKGAILSRERMAPFPVQRQRRCHPSARRAEKRAEALRLVILLMLCERHGNDAVSLFLEAHDDHALRGSASGTDRLDPVSYTHLTLPTKLEV